MVFNYAMKLYNITLLDDESDITLKELPVKFVYKDSKFLGSLTISAGTIIVLGALAYLVKSLIEGESMIHPLIAFGIGLIFFPVFLIGLNMLKKKREFTFTQDFIQKSFSNLFQEEEWKEPIPSYDGILLQTDIQVTRDKGSVLIYALDLLHKDQTKTIRLFKSMEYNAVFSKWKDYCNFFNLPPLERINKEKHISRELKDFGKALIDLIKEEKITLFETLPPIPEKVEIRNESKGPIIFLPDNIEITLGKTAFTVKQETFWKNEIKFEYSDIKSILIDYCKSKDSWEWGIVVFERGSVHRGTFAVNLPYKMLEWLQYYLISETVKRLNLS